MSVFDWILVVLVVFFLVRSLLRGATRELFSLLALVLAGLCAVRYYPLLLPLLSPYISTPLMQNAVALPAIFVGVYCAVSLAGWLLALLIRSISLGLLDRCAGALVGAAKAYVIICCIIILLLQFPSGADMLKRSALAAYCMPGVVWLIENVSPGLDSAIKKTRGLLSEAGRSVPAPGRKKE